MILFENLSVVLRMAGEPTRLRILALCDGQRVAVSEFAAVLGHSEPSISRHLKLLEEAGLVSRARQGQRVYFRVQADQANASVARALLTQLDTRERLLQADQQRLRILRSVAGAAAATITESRLGRALAVMAKSELAQGATPRHVLVQRLRHVELLQPLFAAASRVQVAVKEGSERDALRRWIAEREIEGGSRLQFADSDGFSDPRRFDLVVIDCSVEGREAVARAVTDAAQRLAPQGKLWLLAGYDALDAGDRAEHPLLLLRRLLSAAGLNCERLQPVEADGSHILFSISQPAASQRRIAS